MRDAVAFGRALALLVRETRKAFERNGHKKDPARERPDYWFKKLEKEELLELYRAWMSGDRERILEEIGDCGMCLVGILLQGAYHVGEKANYHLGEE